MNSVIPALPQQIEKCADPLQCIAMACFTLFALSVSCLAMAMTSVEEPEIFTPLAAAQLKHMSPLQQQRIDRIRQMLTTASMTMVRVHTDALRAEGAGVSLPGSKTLQFSKNKIENWGEDGFTWFGDRLGVPGAILVVDDGNITGTIRDEEKLYRIEPVGDGVHVLIKVDESRFPPEEPSFMERALRAGSEPMRATTPDMRDSNSPVEIDVLVAYTPGARTAVFDIAATIRLAVAETNQSYENSRVRNRLTMVDNFEIAYSESGKSYSRMLDDFKVMGDVINRRNFSGADISVLIVNQPDNCGVAPLPADAANAFAVVYYSCATGYYSFAHEIGHLHGARHEQTDDAATWPYAHGHGFQYMGSSGSRWRTIMAYDCPGGCPRVQYWSNPSVTYNGVPMGTMSTNDNARVLNETASAFAGFRARPRSLAPIYFLVL